MTMEPIVSTPTSRRALLTGLVGGLAAAVAGTLGRVQPVAAGGVPVELGASNSAAAPTTIANTNGTAFSGYAGGNGTGVYGSSYAGT
jgi:hypothetical protein